MADRRSFERTTDRLSLSPGAAGILSSLWRQKVLILIITLAVVGLTVGALFVLPVRYLATGTVIVAEPDPGVADPSAVLAQKSGDPADLESQLMILRSPRLMRLALAQPGIIEAVERECRSWSWRRLLLLPERCDNLSPDDPELIDRVTDRYSITSAGRSRVINIGYRSSTPEIAQMLANALINAFLADQRDGMSNERESAAKWMWQELARLDSDIHAQDAQIEDYRRSKGLMRGATASIASERLTNISQQLAGAQQAKAQAAARLKESHGEQAGGASSATSVLDNRAIADLKQQIAVARRQLAAATTVFGPRHPQLRLQQDSLTALQQQLSVETSKISESAQKDYDSAANLVISLQSQMKNATDEAASAASDEASIETMVRGVGIKRQQYAELYQRASALETERRSLLGSTRLISLAELPLEPVFPKRTAFLGIGLALGLLLGSAAALAREKLKTFPGRAPERLTASNTQRVDVSSAAERSPPRVEMPKLKSGSLLDGDTVSLSSALWKSSSREMKVALDTLLIALLEQGLCGSVRHILVTSEVEGEGKTFTTIALARAAAEAGMKVLAIECVPDNGGFEDAFVFDSESGLFDVLTADADPNLLIQDGTIDGFHLLPSGKGIMSFKNVATRRSMQALLDWAGSYDFVLLDGPAFGSEAAALSVLADGLLICTDRDISVDENEAAAGRNGLRGRLLATVATTTHASAKGSGGSFGRSRTA